MSPFAASPGDPAAPPVLSTVEGPVLSTVEGLERHVLLLQARKDVLERVLATSVEVRAALESPGSPESSSGSGQDIDELLERRDQECRRFAALCQENEPVLSTVEGDVPELAAAADDHGLSESARLAISLDGDIQRLSEQILACQTECQSIMRARLDALAGAIRESVQRRKVESAYGPATSHDTPVFLDKQQ